MIIDAHAHLVTPKSLQAFWSVQSVSNGLHDHLDPGSLDEEIKECAAANVAIMDSVGTDMQLLSPRPFTLMHSHKRAEDVVKWIKLNNNFVARTVELYPTRFRGVAALPQIAGEPVSVVFDEIDRCINELGFVGVLVNPDPGEGDGKTPNLAEKYWYPLYEKLVEMDIPAHIHSAACCGRETYSEHFISEESLAITSITRSAVFKDFPTLKLMISHGGGSVPYQVGRWRAQKQGYETSFGKNNKENTETFDDILQKFYFDTVLYNKESLELLFKIVGPDRCLFGTEKPGSGSAKDPKTGRYYDDLKPVIEEIEFLSQEEKANIFENNARSVFTRLDKFLKEK